MPAGMCTVARRWRPSLSMVKVVVPARIGEAHGPGAAADGAGTWAMVPPGSRPAFAAGTTSATAAASAAARRPRRRRASA
jgi:hypothetical protein